MCFEVKAVLNVEKVSIVKDLVSRVAWRVDDSATVDQKAVDGADVGQRVSYSWSRLFAYCVDASDLYPSADCQ